MAAGTPTAGLPRFRPGLLHPRYWLQWLALGCFYLLTLMPMRVIDGAATRLGRLMLRANRKRVRYATVNLGLCFPELGEDEVESLVREHFAYQARSILHYGLIWWAPARRLERLIELEGGHLVDACREQGRNIIALTSHSVGLELSVTALSMAFDCSGPYKPMKNGLVDWLVAKGRSRFGVRAYTRGAGLRPLIRDTRAGRVLIYLADEDLGPGRSVFAPFFGVQKATIPVLARLAKQCNAAVLPCTSCYDIERRKYVVRLYDPLEGFEACDEQASARRMNTAVEQTVRACVAQYFWTLRLFKTRPEGEASVYAG